MMFNIVKKTGQRLLFSVGTLLIVSAIIFFCVNLLPGDYATSTLGQNATPEAVAKYREQLGLDRPAVARYLDWFASAVRGDFGLSFSSVPGNERAVSNIVLPRIRNSLFLAGVTASISIPWAIFLGVLCARFRNTWLDRLLNGVSLSAISCPEFLLAYLLMLILSVKLGMFYSLANIDPNMTLFEVLSRMSLPIMTLTLLTTAHMMRMTRTAVIGVLSKPFIEMAYCKGLSQTRILIRHALPNAWAPIVNVASFSLSYLVVGIVVVEVAFAYPGIGQTMVDAVRSRDIPVIQACALIFAATFIVVNFVADMVSDATNPRILHP